MKNGKRLAALVCVAVLMMTAMMPVAMAAEETWVCPNCAKINSGNFCGNCGTKKPSWLCVCGKENTGNFCENCGLPKDQAAEAKEKLNRTVGNYVTFGAYEQDNDESNGQEPIERLVLDYDAVNNRALLISRYGLDAQRYNTEKVDITWEKCTLRTWLNSTFLNKAFTTKEQSDILLTNVDNSKSQGYSGWSTSGGNNTQDKVFLLSYAEANKYMGVTYDDSKNTKSMVSPTAYAIKQGAFTYSSHKTADGAAAGWWWLRSPGDYQSDAVLVSPVGSLDRYGVSGDGACVRPALWINLETGIF